MTQAASQPLTLASGDAYQFPRRPLIIAQPLMKDSRKVIPIQIFRADNNPCVVWVLLMESNKVATILGNNSSTISRCKG